MKPTILFLGTPSFAVPILEGLHENFTVLGVVTQPDRPVGRKLVLTPPPIKTKALELGLKIYQPEKSAEIASLALSPIDFLVTAAYGEYLPEKVLKLASKDALNVHPSLLPQYRGATPLQSALLNGDQTTGVSIIRMVKEMDAGEIFAQNEITIPRETKYLELEAECAALGAKLIVEVIKNYDAISPVAQDEKGVSHCKKISKEDGQIDWQKESAEQIYNKLRAFTPWPGIYTFFKQQKLSLLDFWPSGDESPNKAPPGTVFQMNDGVHVQCSMSSIVLTQIQLAGKKPTDPKSFANGHPDFIGTILQ